MENIRLMLVDDHDVVRTGLKTFLQTQDGLEVVAEANNGAAAIDLASRVSPNLVIMDITMDGMDGLEATRQIKQVCSDCKVLALTIHADKEYFLEMLAAGADGYVTKQVAAEELVGAIHTVVAGQVYLQPALTVFLLEDYQRLLAHESAITARSPDKVNGVSSEDRNRLETLSEREIQVLKLITEGLTNIETGEKLGISHKTVARHRERIMSKLEIHSCVDLVRFAVRTGLIEIC